ncbi:GNAT family N-acetyltransferase [Streptomyces sp. NPDC001744]|uniref:GNAT family N-acetyltransferase n=1 Tax=Streptomyces sp. NPDC001744 TaxID=3364606 RepID=UPI0036C2BE1C
MDDPTRVRLEPWSAEDDGLLRALNAPELTDHLGGPETGEQLARRHLRYVGMSAGAPDAGRMFRIVLLPEEVTAGSVGFWPRTWDDEPVYETGWAVLPGFQGRGVATAAARAVIAEVSEVVKGAKVTEGAGDTEAAGARATGLRRFLHAFPSTDNAASNAVCRGAGFELRGERDFAYPPGRPMRCNDWRFGLAGPDQGV